jgi:hypothetical protein
MATYTVQLDRKHASLPSVCWDVTIWDMVDGGALSELGGHQLYVPTLESWLPDTLRLVLYELSAYLPAHAPEAAQVIIEARQIRPRRRAMTRPRKPWFNHDVHLCVEAGGWRADVRTSRDARIVKAGEERPDPGRFTEPMQACLLELAARSPFPLSSIRPEYSGDGDGDDPTWATRLPSRVNVQRGEECAWDAERKEWRSDLFDEHRRRLENLRRPRAHRRLPDIQPTGREALRVHSHDDEE